VVALGIGLPDSLKVHRREGKVALRRAFAGHLPPDVAARTKSGFGVPLDRWFRSDLRETAHDLLANDRGWFRQQTVRKLLDEHESARADHGHRLWCLLMLELWVREHVEAPVLISA
jgi:asparagine synthase (glutamine-hydrolysing)